MPDDNLLLPCELCGRVTRNGSRHHLIPRSCHSNKWFRKRFTREQMRTTVALCKDCHSAVHRFVPSEKDLGRNHNTLESLRAIPELARFIEWVKRRR